MRAARILAFGGLVIALAVAFVPSALAGAEAEEPPHLTVKTRPAYGVEESEALIAGFINPHGRTATYRFQWGPTKKYGTVSLFPEEPLYPGFKGEEIEEFTDGLRPDTVYHFRIVGYSHGLKFFGQDRTFKTLPFHSLY
jgi:hypothetical protein